MLAHERSSLAISTQDSMPSQVPVSEDQLNQFLAALMDRLQERLSVQVTQTLNQLESDHAEAVAKLSSASSDSEVLQLRPRGQLEDSRLAEVRELQSRSDQLLVNIESIYVAGHVLDAATQN